MTNDQNPLPSALRENLRRTSMMGRAVAIGEGVAVFDANPSPSNLVQPTEGPKYPDIEVPLSFEDGNAVAMVTRTVLAMRDEGVPRNITDAFRDEALSGDYDHVLDTIEKWVSVS